MWREIPGFSGYEVNENGEVRNATTHQIKAQRLTTDGYWATNLRCDGKTRKCTVHRLVALAFIPQEDGKPCVNHKDENRQNNHVSNLEWCDVAYNNSYGNAPQKRAFNKSRSVVVKQDGIEIARFASIVGMAKMFGVEPCVIGDVLRNRGGRRKWRGYEVVYATTGTNKMAAGVKKNQA